jgi:low affinity Fe/Cu permease
LSEWFARFTRAVEHIVGSPWAFIAAATSVLVWLSCGPLFHFSDTYQLVANTFTTLITYIMVFILQASSNRHSMALDAKISELILATHGARNRFILAEDMTEEELKRALDSLQRAAKSDPSGEVE